MTGTKQDHAKEYSEVMTLFNAIFCKCVNV